MIIPKKSNLPVAPAGKLVSARQAVREVSLKSIFGDILQPDHSTTTTPPPPPPPKGFRNKMGKALAGFNQEIGKIKKGFKVLPVNAPDADAS